MVRLKPSTEPHLSKISGIPPSPSMLEIIVKTASGPKRRRFNRHGKRINSCSVLMASIPQTIISGPFTMSSTGRLG